jgi:hypothetical protein
MEVVVEPDPNRPTTLHMLKVFPARSNSFKRNQRRFEISPQCRICSCIGEIKPDFIGRGLEYLSIHAPTVIHVVIPHLCVPGKHLTVGA